MIFSPQDLKHLEFLQSTIARQASHSFAVKGWSLTVSTAFFAYTATHLSWGLACLALLPPTTFAWLDAYYLRQERLFRELYSRVVGGDTGVPPMSMDTGAILRASAPRCRWTSVLRSSSWYVLHLTILGVALVLLGIAVVQVLSSAEIT